MSNQYTSWGRHPHNKQAVSHQLWRHDTLPITENVLPQGNARSYGDSCMNITGSVISSRTLNRFIDFNPETGIIRCEAGVTLEQILVLVEPYNWFLPVTPGTRYATVGGCIANDVHGKNHHLAGTFGCHITQLELLRTNGDRLHCSPANNSALFNATIGGLGLTGFIVHADLQLKKIESSAINTETIKYKNLDAFFDLTVSSDTDYEYTVAWIDCLATGTHRGRGHFIRGNHASRSQPKPPAPNFQLSLPITPPIPLINKLTLKAFNTVYYQKQRQESVSGISHYSPFFYPLDGINHWNRLYGPAGFTQYQCVIPPETSRDAIGEILERIAMAKEGSFLAVLKEFGTINSPGLLSFPRPGTTLALDFPFKGKKTIQLFNALDNVVSQSGGAIYPAKDAHMPSDLFKQAYLNLNEFIKHKDPGMNSSFWTRVMDNKL